MSPFTDASPSQLDPPNPIEPSPTFSPSVKPTSSPTPLPTIPPPPTIPSVTELHAFEASGATLLAVTTILALVASAVFQRKGGRFRRYVPSSLLVLLVGGLSGLVARVALGKHEVTQQLPALFDAETFFFVLLPPIVFHAGIAVEKVRFFANLDGIVLYAFLGTVISTLVIGIIVYLAALAEWIPLDKGSPLQSFLFGALISSVDPLAALSVLSDDVDRDLSTLIFGEAVLNDATAISLFQVFLVEYLARRRPDGSEEETFFAHDVFIAVMRFFLVVAGSLLVGLAGGMSIIFAFRRTRFRATLRLQLMAFGALLSYALSEVMGMSGVFSVFTTGVVLSLRLPAEQRDAVLPTFEFFAQTAETVVYINLGIDLVTTPHVWHLGFVVVAVIACLVSRAFNVFPLSTLANRVFRKHSPERHITRPAQWVIFFAGFRGAVCYALSLQLPAKDPGVAVLQSTTLAVVVFSTAVLGTLSYPVTKAAGLIVESHDLNLASPRRESFDEDIVGESSLASDSYEGGHGSIGLRTGHYLYHDRPLRNRAGSEPLMGDDLEEPDGVNKTPSA